MSVIIMRYNDKTELKDKTLKMLQTLSSDRLSKEEKMEKLKNLGMRVDDRIEKEVGKMCNIGDYIEAKAEERTKIRIVRLQLEKKKRTPEETAELLDMPLGYIQKIADILQTCAGASDLQIAEQLMNTGI